jgi:hypothetical protein
MGAFAIFIQIRNFPQKQMKFGKFYLNLSCRMEKLPFAIKNSEISNVLVGFE